MLNIYSVVQKYYLKNFYSNKGGALKLYTYRIDDETTKKVNALASSNKDEEKISNLIKDLEKYNKVFDNPDIDLSESVPNFEKMENVEIDDAKIKEQAENELYDYKTSSINKIVDDTNSGIEKLEVDKQNISANYNDAIDNTKSYYSEKKENASQDALKRGLSRSSIVVNVLDAFDKAEISKYNELNDELVSSINNIDTSISQLKLEQDEALNSFDVEYAVKLQEKINTLTENLIKKQNEVLQYNNEIEEKEADYNRKYAELEKELSEANWDKEIDLMEFAGKYGVNMIAKYKETQMYNMAEKYLSSMDKSYALQELENNVDLRQLLGEDNVAKLIAKFQ